LRSRALSFFKAIAIAARWNVDEAVFHQISKKERSREKVTFFHEVVSGRFSFISDRTLGSWQSALPYEEEKIVLPIIKFLVTELGADVNGNSSDCHVKPLYEAVRAGAPLSVIKLLLELGADVNGRNWKGGQTALHSCCARCFSIRNSFDTLVPETAELLLQAGADEDCQDDDGLTAKDIITRPFFIDNNASMLSQRLCDRILAMMCRHSTSSNEEGKEHK